MYGGSQSGAAAGRGADAEGGGGGATRGIRLRSGALAALGRSRVSDAIGGGSADKPGAIATGALVAGTGSDFGSGPTRGARHWVNATTATATSAAATIAQITARDRLGVSSGSRSIPATVCARRSSSSLTSASTNAP